VADERIGSIVGEYRIEALLGTGGFGSVWRATHVQTGEVVAVKILTGAYSTGDNAKQRADIELLASAATNSSPHVVKVLGGGLEPVPWIAMEYVDGTDLASLLRTRGRLPLDETLRIAIALAEALESLFEAGIIHRDVKPANIMIARDGTVKLTDFGIAKIVGYESVTATGQLPMSMAYAAPEVWEGKPSHRSDLYALGILIYQCLVGEPPFTGTFAEIYRKHLATAPTLDRLPEATPPALKDLLARCLAKDPARRPTTATECRVLLERCQGVVSEGPPSTPASRVPERFGPWVRLAPHATLAWARRCRHETTGQEATVEVVASDDVHLGDQLRAAVAANAELVPLGAERLLGSNRIILRPGEAWDEQPPGKFQFWVAREEQDEDTSVVFERAELEAQLERIASLRRVGASLGVAVSTLPANLRVLPDRTIQVLRPGVP
jgi:hypothetical protein